MKFCIKCGTQNEEYYNYCSKDGESLDTQENGLVLRENIKEYCDLCGTQIKKSDTYCSNCGKMLSEVGMKTKYKGSTRSSNNFDYINTKKVDFDTDKIVKDAESVFKNLPGFFENIVFSLKKFDYANFARDNIKNALTTGLLSTAFTAILPLIITIIIFTLISDGSDMGSFGMNLIGLSAPKIFFMNLVSILAPKYMLSSSGVTLGMALRQILTPLIAGICIFAATNITIKRKDVNSLPMAVLISLIYSVIMAIISLFSRYAVAEYFSMYATISSVFVNAFIIAFVASILSLERENSKNIGTVSNIFRFNLRIVFSMLAAITIFFIAYIYISLGTSELSYYISQYSYEFGSLLPESAGIALFLCILIILFVMSPWIFLMMNLVSLNMFVISNSIFSTGKGMLLVLIPIIMFVLIGRTIKTKYGEGRNDILVTHSLCYTCVMFLLSYFSKLIFSGDLSKISEFISPLEGLLNQSGEYVPSVASGYIGMSCFMTIIITFIFSIAFIYVGYRTKKTN